MTDVGEVVSVGRLVDVTLVCACDTALCIWSPVAA